MQILVGALSNDSSCVLLFIQERGWGIMYEGNHLLEMGEGIERVFLCLLFFSCFHLKITLWPKWHNLGWLILIHLFTPGRNLINVIEVGKFSIRSQTSESIRNSQGIKHKRNDCAKTFIQTHILYCITELIHMKSPVNVTNLGMLSARNHTFRRTHGEILKI